MSQDFLSIDPSVPGGDTGTTLAGKLNDWRAAVLSLLSGTSRPSAALAGTVWRDTSATPWSVKLYDGTDDVVLFRIDPTNHRPIFDGAVPWAAAGGTANALTATYAPAIGALIDGMLVGLKAGAANSTTTPTFAPNGLTAKTIVKLHNQALAAGDISGAGHELLLRYVSLIDKWVLFNPAASGGGGSYTDEQAQDAVGTILSDSGDVDFTYTDATPAITADVKSNAITNAKLADMAQATVKGRAVGAGSGDPTDLSAAQLVAIVAAADGSGSGLDADTIDGVESANLLRKDVEDQTITGGAGVTSKSLGTQSSGTLTLDLGDRPLQHYTNNGAHTLAPGSVAGAAIVDITNGASAGAITTSGFTKVAGDPFTTTNGHKFRCHVSVANGGSLLVVQALQ